MYLHLGLSVWRKSFARIRFVGIIIIIKKKKAFLGKQTQHFVLIGCEFLRF